MSNVVGEQAKTFVEKTQAQPSASELRRARIAERQKQISENNEKLAQNNEKLAHLAEDRQGHQRRAEEAKAEASAILSKAYINATDRVLKNADKNIGRVGP